MKQKSRLLTGGKTLSTATNKMLVVTLLYSTLSSPVASDSSFLTHSRLLPKPPASDSSSSALRTQTSDREKWTPVWENVSVWWSLTDSAEGEFWRWRSNKLLFCFRLSVLTKRRSHQSFHRRSRRRVPPVLPDLTWPDILTSSLRCRRPLSLACDVFTRSQTD